MSLKDILFPRLTLSIILILLFIFFTYLAIGLGVLSGSFGIFTIFVAIAFIVAYIGFIGFIINRLLIKSKGNKVVIGAAAGAFIGLLMSSFSLIITGLFQLITGASAATGRAIADTLQFPLALSKVFGFEYLIFSNLFIHVGYILGIWALVFGIIGAILETTKN